MGRDWTEAFVATTDACAVGIAIATSKTAAMLSEAIAVYVPRRAPNRLRCTMLILP
jgi:hypothetical protein